MCVYHIIHNYMSNISKQYAHLLDTKETLILTKMLMDKIGNLKDTAGKCDLTRRTLYKWTKEPKDIKIENKEKILQNALDELPLITLEWLCNQMIDKVRRLIMIHLSTILEQLMEENTERAIKQYEEYKRKYAGLIYERYEDEISELDERLIQYVKFKNMKLDISSIRLYNLNELEEIILKIITKDFSSVKELAINYQLSLPFLEKLDKLEIDKDQEISKHEELQVGTKWTTLGRNDVSNDLGPAHIFFKNMEMFSPAGTGNVSNLPNEFSPAGTGNVSNLPNEFEKQDMQIIKPIMRKSKATSSATSLDEEIPLIKA